MAPKVFVREPNPTVRGAIQRALDHGGFVYSDVPNDDTEVALVCMSGEDSDDDILAILSALPASTVSVLASLGDQVAPALVEHPSVVRTLVKPFRPVDLLELIGMAHRDATGNTFSADPHKQSTRRYTAPANSPWPGLGDGQAPDLPAASDSSAPLLPVVEEDDDQEFSVQKTGQGPSIWRALGYEIALMLPTWTEIDGAEARAEAIAAWLDQRIDS